MSLKRDGSREEGHCANMAGLFCGQNPVCSPVLIWRHVGAEPKLSCYFTVCWGLYLAYFLANGGGQHLVITNIK